jgi:ABC-type multidrug transport system ATPase subunit
MFYRLVVRVPLIGRRRRPFRALDRVSLEIGSGMFGLVGPNGAGKTTLMRIICGILEPTRGKVTVNEIDIEQHREELQAMIGYLPQEFGTYENMTAHQFLDYQALLRGIRDPQKRAQAVGDALRAVHLEQERGTRIRSFSGGMKQRIGIAQTLLHLPRILVVDEPTAGLDPRERIRFRNLLAELARERVVVFSTHIIEDISSSCSQVAVLDQGRLKFLGSPRELAARAQGAVWQVDVPEEDFESVRERHRVVYHLREGESIRVRILAAAQPLPKAKAVLPTLEESYLWLLERGQVSA